ncbi:MAG TPA: hypothetical protein VFV11_03150 [Solimonas sp.]|nr:hypothetical protein [Solimonas sp.]
MKSKAWMMAVVSVAVGVGTYLGLKAFAPQGLYEEEAVAMVTEDQVFGGTLAPAPIEDAPAAEVTSATDAAPAEMPTDTPVEDAAAPAETPAESTEVAAAEPAPVEPEPAPAPVETAPAPEPEPEPAPAPKPKAKPKAQPKPAPAEAATSWWLPEGPKSQLSVVYAGSMSGQKAIAVLFNGAFDDANGANQQIVVTSGGSKVAGSWSVSPNNKRMLTFPVAKSGSYRVSVGAKLTDRTGRKLGRVQAGPVSVK